MTHRTRFGGTRTGATTKGSSASAFVRSLALLGCLALGCSAGTDGSAHDDGSPSDSSLVGTEASPVFRADLPTAIAHPDILLDGGESTSGWSGTQLDTTDFKFGNASLRRTASTARFFRTFATPVDVSNTRFLTFWYFIDDPSKIVNTDQQVEIGSAGTWDQQERNWNVTSLHLQRGWNYVVLDIAGARHRTAANGIQADLTKINWFRIHHHPNATVTTRIDQIVFTNHPSVSLAFSQYLDRKDSLSRHADGNGLADSTRLAALLRLAVNDTTRRRECRKLQLLRQRRAVSQVGLDGLGVAANGWSAIRQVESYMCGETTITGNFDQVVRTTARDYLAAEVNLVKQVAVRFDFSEADAAQTLWKLFELNEIRIHESCGTVNSEVTTFMRSGTNPAGITGPNALFRNCAVSSLANLPQEIAVRIGGGRSLTGAGDRYRACWDAFANQASDCSNAYAQDSDDGYREQLKHHNKYRNDPNLLEQEVSRMSFLFQEVDSFNLDRANDEIDQANEEEIESVGPVTPNVEPTHPTFQTPELEDLHQQFDNSRGRMSVARMREEEELRNAEAMAGSDPDFAQEARARAEAWHHEEAKHYLEAEETRRKICEQDPEAPLCKKTPPGEPEHPLPTPPKPPVEEARCSEISVDGHAAWYETSTGIGGSREINSGDRMDHCLCEVFDRQYPDLPQFQVVEGVGVSSFCPDPQERVKHECTQPGWDDGPPSRQCRFGLVSEELDQDELTTRLCWAMRSASCPDPRILSNGECNCSFLPSGGQLPPRNCIQSILCPVDSIPDDQGCGCRNFDLPVICPGNVLTATRPTINTFDGVAALAGRPALSVSTGTPLVTRALTTSTLTNGNRFAFKVFNPDAGGAMTATADVRCTNLDRGVTNYLVDRVAIANLGSGTVGNVSATFSATDLDRCFGTQRVDASHLEVAVKPSRPAPRLAFVADLDFADILDPIVPNQPCVTFPPQGPGPRPPTWNMSTGQVIRSDVTVPFPRMSLDGLIFLPSVVAPPVYFVKDLAPGSLSLIDRGSTPTTSTLDVTRDAPVNTVTLQLSLRGEGGAGRYGVRLLAPNGTLVHEVSGLQGDGELFDGGILIDPTVTVSSKGLWTLQVRDIGGNNDNIKSGDLYSWSLNFNPVEAFDESPESEGTFPAGWSCNGQGGFEDFPGEFFGDGACDCGCGAMDVDCASNNLSQCEFQFCPSGRSVNPNNIALCL